MKKLFLLRHAKSTREYPELLDFERPLSIRGRSDIALMADYMKEKKFLPEIIISSPASRTMTTSRLLAEGLDYNVGSIIADEQLYEAWLEDIIEVTRNIDNNFTSAIIVGHNPGLQLFAEYLKEFPEDNLPTCGLALFHLKIKSWADVTDGCGKLMLFQSPKKLAK